MYQKYQTEALVLRSREQGEADKLVALYTREFGLVRARAGGLRKEASRMRYALQDYAHAHVALVRGKSNWRVAGASSIENASHHAPAAAAFARISNLVLRLVHGQERNEYLFAALAEAHHALMAPACEAWATIEIVCVARVLYALGYLSSEALSTTLFMNTGYEQIHLAEAEHVYDALLSSVNQSLAETQL